jgi:hypothetical protein
MDTAAGVIGFVCLMFFCSTDFPTVFHDKAFERPSDNYLGFFLLANAQLFESFFFSH